MIDEAGKNAIGYVGGGLLAVCLIPQIVKLLITRSARDISLAWSFLYLTGTALMLWYLILEGAVAAYIPLIIETIACLLTLVLKLLFDHTRLGRHPELEIDAYNPDADVSIHSTHGICRQAPSAVPISDLHWPLLPGRRSAEHTQDPLSRSLPNGKFGPWMGPQPPSTPEKEQV
jgi:uncharacterized protein with PQ loop repeat